MLALAATALVLWAPAVTLPLVYVEQFGASGSVSVTSSAAALLDDRYGLVAAVVLGTLVLMPAAQMIALLVAMARLHAGGRPRRWLWWYRQGREWAMPEIFLLGALIATTELGESASLRLGAGLFCLLGLVVARWVAEGWRTRRCWTAFSNSVTRRPAMRPASRRLAAWALLARRRSGWCPPICCRS
ncbi:paraquat-inducible protein A [Alcanivorax sp. IO_7]|nr:paraquat-inducible protein A [Alcanivorax sp. IO_7]